MTDTILIYGGAGGIGSQTARALKAQGFDLHLAGRNAATLKTVADEIGAGMSVGNVCDEGFLAETTKAAASRGPLAGLVYAVGTISLKPFARLTEDDFLSDFRLNALGAARAAQAAIAPLTAYGKTSTDKSASILFFSTVAVAQGFAAHASIAMAKGAIEGLTRALAAECAPHIRVNAIAPSLTRTPLARSMTDSEQMAKAIAGLHAMQRIGEPGDIAELAAFLVSPKAGWISGQIIGVDGGRSTLRTKG